MESNEAPHRGTARARLLLLFGCLLALAFTGDARVRSASVVMLPASVLASVNSEFRESNKHWDEQGSVPTIAQMTSQRSTQREYLGLPAR
jgi:hypothetical protein